MPTEVMLVSAKIPVRLHCDAQQHDDVNRRTTKATYAEKGRAIVTKSDEEKGVSVRDVYVCGRERDSLLSIPS